jgi:hypothetical protein
MCHAIHRLNPYFPQNPPSEPACFDRVYGVYERIILSIADCIEPYSRPIQILIIVFFLEIDYVIKICFDTVFYGCCRTPHFANVNPDELTQEQLQIRPVLCLHGNFLKPTAYTGIAQALADSYNPGVFTVELPSGGGPDEEDDRIIEEKINEIQALYRSYGVEIKVDVIGHSRGAAAANRFSQHESVEKLVLLGWHFPNLGNTQQNPNKCFEINGSRDYLIPPHLLNAAADISIRDPAHRHLVPQQSHLSLLYSEEMYAKLIESLHS